MNMKKLFDYNYRKDPKTCQFNNTIWLFGCSHIYGYDLPEDQTAAAILEKMIGIPVINLGISGGNVFNIKHNLSVLLKTYRCTPKAIIIAWPLPTRWTDPTGFNWGSWYFEEQLDSLPGLRDTKLDPVRFKEYKELLLSGKLETLSYECIDDIRKMIEPYTSVEFVYTSPKLGPPVKTNMIHYVDYMPDNLHPGPKTNIIAAEWLAEQLKAKSIEDNYK